MKRPSINWKQTVKEWIWMTVGTVIVAIGIHFFKFPNNFSTGGVTGLGVILAPLLPFLSRTLITNIINIAFLIMGFIVLKASFGVKTVYCSLLFSGVLEVLEWLAPLTEPMTDQPLLELFFAVILPALGSGILFNIGASTGGTDIVAMVLKKFTAMDTGTALLVSDVLIAGATLFIFDIKTGLFSLLGLVLKSVVVDTVIESLNRRKSFTVITSHPQEVTGFITKKLGRSATVWQGKGAYTDQELWVVLVALSRVQAVALRKYVKEVDPHAFLLITNSSEIFGKGFMRA